MDLNQVLSTLRREKELLTEILALAECQMDLLESGRTPDLEVLISLRAGPMAELSAMEESLVNGTSEIVHSGDLRPDALEDFESLNFEILQLAGQIADMDEKLDWLAGQYETSYSWSQAGTGAC